MKKLGLAGKIFLLFIFISFVQLIILFCWVTFPGYFYPSSQAFGTYLFSSIIIYFSTFVLALFLKRKKKRVIIVLLIILFYLILINSVSFLFFKALFRFDKEFGPEIKNIQVDYLDLNKNGKYDAIKVKYTVVSPETIIAFGGTEMCLGDKYRVFECKSLSIDYPDPNTDESGHPIICPGENTFTRYFSLEGIHKVFGKDQFLEISMIGANTRFMHKIYKLPNQIDFRDFEPLLVGRYSFPDHYNYKYYLTVDAPPDEIIDKNATFENSCREWLETNTRNVEIDIEEFNRKFDELYGTK